MQRHWKEYMENVIVIGGGILGTSVAWRLAENGAEVSLFEAGGIGQGVSAVSFAWLTGSSPEDRSYFQLKIDALNDYRVVQRELSDPSWLHLNGHIEWNSAASETLDAFGYDGLPVAEQGVSGQERLRRKARQLREWGFTVELLPVRELAALEPGLRVPGDVEEFAFYPMEGYVEPVAATGAFAWEAKRHGARVVEGVPVTGFVREGGEVRGVVTGDGERHHADLVVVCAGSWTGKLLEGAGITLPMSPVDGMVAVSSPSAARLGRVVHTDSLSLRPDGAGRIMMRNHEYDRLVDASKPVPENPEWLGELLSRAVSYLPELESARIEALRVGTRPIPGDGLPVVGALPEVPGLYMMVAHGAVTLASLLGRLAAREIVHGEADARLDAFRPARIARVA